MESNVNHEQQISDPKCTFCYFETRDNFNHKLIYPEIILVDYCIISTVVTIN